MKKLVFICFVVFFISLSYSNRVLLNDAGDHVWCNPINATDWRIEINIGSLDCDKGDISFSQAFRKFLPDYSLEPMLEIHLAVAASGDYIAQTIPNYQFINIPSPTDIRATAETVTLSKPYIMRDLRGIDIIVSPFQSFDGKLKVADRIVIDLIHQEGHSGIQNKTLSGKLNPYFTDIYKEHFINYDPRYEDLAEYGSMAVICPDEFRDLITPWVDWKIQKGIPTTVYSTDETGHTYESIKAFILNLYQTDGNLTFVQLIGDYAQVPCLVSGVENGRGGRDADYSLLVGDDWYPEIFIGRFSAETPVELYTQLKRSIEYERDITGGEWLNRSAGVCSNNPPIPGDDDEYNLTHLDNIRTRLLESTYSSIDRVYANEGATTQDFVDCLNEGKSLLNYCGEGYPTYWVAPRLSINDVQNLTNTGMLPFIFAVSCWTGQFYNGTCLGEAFMRSNDGSGEEAKGAIAIYTSAPTQGVSEPMRAQDHMVDLLLAGSKNTIGGLCYNGCSNMTDVYGDAGGYYFWGWNLFGDASLVLRTKTPDEIAVTIPNHILPGTGSLTLQTNRPNMQAALTIDGSILARAFADSTGVVTLNWTDNINDGDRLMLTLSGFNLKTIQQDIYCRDAEQMTLYTSMLGVTDRIEPEMTIERTFRIVNISSVTARHLQISMEQDFPYFVPIETAHTVGNLNGGDSTDITLSFRISKEAVDWSILPYTVVVTADGFSQEYHYQETIHAPDLQITSIRRLPQSNWIIPGCSFTSRYRIENRGSADLRGTIGTLNPATNDLMVLNPQTTDFDIQAGTADSLEFDFQVRPTCQSGIMVNAALKLNSNNAPESVVSQQWRVIAPAAMMESFETKDLHAFPWIVSSGQWQISDDGYDGMYSLLSDAATQVDSNTVTISFTSLEPGEVSYFYRKSATGSKDVVHVYINNVLESVLGNNSDWERVQMHVNEGHNTVSWVVSQSYIDAKDNGSFKLDAIEFPPRTVFEQTNLITDKTQLSIVMRPGDIVRVPVILSSYDGKYIHYDAVLQKSVIPSGNKGTINLRCNKDTFHPGATESYLFTLYNASPAQRLKRISVSLPETSLLTSATSFSMSGTVGLPFTGGLGSLSEMVWENPAGSMLDSLRTGVRISTDACLRELELHYTVESEGSGGDVITTDGVIELICSDSLSEFLSMADFEGEIVSDGKGELLLTANQNLWTGQATDYQLNIYYNGSYQVTIPVTVSYDENPPGFFDKMHLSIYPNPVKTESAFAFAVPKDGRAELTVYNLKGQKVKTLLNEVKSKGYYRTAWKGDNESGNKIANGVYLCKLKVTGGKEKTIKCMVMK